MLKQVITKNADVVKFVEHFGTKASMKNILKGFNNPKGIQVILEDDRFAEEILAYGNIAGNLETVLVDVFKSYEETYMEWKTSGNTRSYPDRVQFILGLIDERIKTEPGPDIVTSLGDFAKSATGKTIEKVMKDAGNDSDDDLMDIMIYTATRHLINKTMVEEEEPVKEVIEAKEEPVVEVVEAEVVEVSPVENHAHEETKVKEPEVLVTEVSIVPTATETKEEEPDDEDELVDKFIHMLENPKAMEKLAKYFEAEEDNTKEEPVKKEPTSRRGFMPGVMMESHAHETVAVASKEPSTVSVDKFLDAFYNTENYSISEIDQILNGVYGTIARNPELFAKEFNSYTPMNPMQASSLRSIIEGVLPYHKKEEINGVKVYNLIASMVDGARDIYGDGNKQNAARATMTYMVYGLLSSFVHLHDKETWVGSMKDVLMIKKFLIERNGENLESLTILRNLRTLIESVNKAIEIPTERPKPGIGMVSKLLMNSMHDVGSSLVMDGIYKWIYANVA